MRLVPSRYVHLRGDPPSRTPYGRAWLKFQESGTRGIGNRRRRSSQARRCTRRRCGRSGLNPAGRCPAARWEVARAVWRQARDLWLTRAAGGVAHTAIVFILSECCVDLPLTAARTRFVRLADLGGLNPVSRSAYEHGLRSLIRVGPLGDALGASKLVEVRFLEPVDRDGVTTVGLRWEATGPAAGLFPVLDANITLTADGACRTKISFAGAYRAPLGRLGAGLDRAVMHRVADATICTLLADLAAALASPCAVPAPEPVPAASQQVAGDAAEG